MSFVIYVNGQRDYYSGKTYTHQGETFPCVCKRDEAKRYKSKKIADNVAKTLDRKCDEDFDVQEIED